MAVGLLPLALVGEVKGAKAGGRREDVDMGERRTLHELQDVGFSGRVEEHRNAFGQRYGIEE